MINLGFKIGFYQFYYGAEDVKNWAEDFTDDIGQAISGDLSILNPFD